MVEKENEIRKGGRGRKEMWQERRERGKVLIYQITQIYNIPEEPNLQMSTVWPTCS
jgi:hypothetical protein